MTYWWHHSYKKFWPISVCYVTEVFPYVINQSTCLLNLNYLRIFEDFTKIKLSNLYKRNSTFTRLHILNFKNLTHFWPIFSFYNPWKYQKTKYFLVFSGSIKCIKVTIARNGITSFGTISCKGTFDFNTKTKMITTWQKNPKHTLSYL